MCKQIVKDQIYQCNGTCGASGTVWGSGLYTGDSNIYQAAKHFGLVPGKFLKTSMGPQNAFQGTTQNEVNTMPYGFFATSFVLSPLTIDAKSQISDLFDQFSKELICQIDSLQEQFLQELEQQFQEMNCTVCKINPRQYLVFPCNHFHFCRTCVKQIIQGKCSVCSQAVTGHMRAYL